MASIKGLRPKVQRLAQALVAACKAQKITIQITQGLRTIAEQNAVYAQGRTKPGGIVTNAKGGQSYHNYGLAFDICPISKRGCDWNATATYAKVGAIGKSLGLEWGGDWKSFRDVSHFQYSAGYSIADLIASRVDWSRFD